MAGAVSAGSFTGGVVDYLIETLDLWEKAKQNNLRLGPSHPEYDHSIPMHDVEIDVISGSSAGGITSTLALLNLVDNDYKPVNKDNPDGDNNRFYQSWVQMADDKQSSTLDKMLATDDLRKLKKQEKPESLLNNEPIEIIAKNALHIENQQKYPPYIADDLDLILPTTNLRGINFQIDFGISGNEGPVITSHAEFFRYKLATEKFTQGIPEADKLYYVLDIQQPRYMGYLKEATLSIAAFPIGLKSRKVAISQQYISRFPKYLFGQKNGIKPIVKDNNVYNFNSIDGGLINNEPFAIALKVLKEKNPVEIMRDRYAVIMIDPFPNRDTDPGDENIQTDMISVAKGMFKALRNQALFNQDGILDAIEGVSHTKFLIEPVRNHLIDGKLVRAKSDLTSAPFRGFAGFMDRNFRDHDYHLGRLNCQPFLRFYFNIPQDHIETKLGTFPHPDAFERFHILESRRKENSRKCFSIIPDMRVLKAKSNIFDSINFGSDVKLSYPRYPHISEEIFFIKNKKLIKKRIEQIFNTQFRNFWINLSSKLFLSNKLSNVLTETVLNELRNNELIK